MIYFVILRPMSLSARPYTQAYVLSTYTQKDTNITKKALFWVLWLDWVDSNHRPPPYQGGALTYWATIHRCGGDTRIRKIASIYACISKRASARTCPRLHHRVMRCARNGMRVFSPMVEIHGFEPRTSWMQIRRSTNWAISPRECYKIIAFTHLFVKWFFENSLHLQIANCVMVLSKIIFYSYRMCVRFLF